MAYNPNLQLFSGSTHADSVAKVTKHERILELARQFSGQGRDARYEGYFQLFNQQKYYEAHDILEDLWLADKRGPDGNFYKGLIQLAGAFVHIQKNRLIPAAAVFQLAQSNLEKYPFDNHQGLRLTVVLELIGLWQDALACGEVSVNPVLKLPIPKLQLQR